MIKSASTHTELGVIIASSLFSNNMRVAHCFHNTLVPCDGRFQSVETHCQLCRRLTSVNGLAPNN